MYYNGKNINIQHPELRFLSKFICPFCKSYIKKQDNSYICPNNHCFDIAKEGYIHLLPVNKMHSKIPGDTKDMVSARRSFLDAGYYKPFSDMLNDIIMRYASDKCTVIDAGCGEGYYTGRLKSFLDSRNTENCISGFDISKFAVKLASKKYKNIEFAVASIFDIPVNDETADIVINIFAPIVEKEFLRILKKSGKLIIAVPGEYHLWGLKQLAYDEPYVNEVKHTEYEGFRFIERVAVEDEIQLDNNEQIQNLFSMTPYYWKTDIEGSNKIKECSYLKTKIHFDFLVYEKE